MDLNGPLFPPAMKVHDHTKETFRDRIVTALAAYDEGNNELLKTTLEGLYELRRDYLIERMTNVELIEKEAHLAQKIQKAQRDGYDEFLDSWCPFLKAIEAELGRRGFD